MCKRRESTICVPSPTPRCPLLSCTTICSRSGTRPAAVRVERSFHLHSEVDQAAVSVATRRLGWRVYVTNHPEQTLSLEQAVLAYREEYLVERGFGRLKGKPLSLAPMYVQ